MGTRTVSQTINLSAPDQTSKYITEIGNNGISVHPNNNLIDAVQITDQIDILRDGSSVMAIGETNEGTGNNVVRIGESRETRVEMDYHSMQLIDKEGNTYLHVSDFREANGLFTSTETYTATGWTTHFDTNYYIYELLSVTVSGTDVTSTTVKHNYYIELQQNPSVGATVIITYTTNSAYTKAFTFGSRNDELNSNIGGFSSTLGYHNVASGMWSHAEGFVSQALADSAHAEGANTTASGLGSHAEGFSTRATGNYSHAEGESAGIDASFAASGYASHSEGYNTKAAGDYSHAEGNYVQAIGKASHAEGYYSRALGDYSHAQNLYTVAQRKSQTVIGKYNIADVSGSSASDLGEFALIIGNGTADNARSNALTVDWDGQITRGDGASYTAVQITRWF